MYDERFHCTGGQRGVGGRDVPRDADRMCPTVSSAARDDVRGWGVHHHHAGGRRRLDVDVVEADAGTGDDLEAPVPRRSPRRRSWWRTARGRRARRTAPPQGRTGAPLMSGSSKSGPRASTVAGDSFWRSGRPASTQQSVFLTRDGLVSHHAIDASRWVTRSLGEWSCGEPHDGREARGRGRTVPPGRGRGASEVQQRRDEQLEVEPEGAGTGEPRPRTLAIVTGRGSRAG